METGKEEKRDLVKDLESVTQKLETQLANFSLSGSGVSGNVDEGFIVQSPE